MKDKALIYISKQYVYKKCYEKILNKFMNLYTYIFCKFNSQLPKEMKLLGIKYELISSEFLYNYLRDDISLVIIFYDLEDKHAQELIKYCTLHSLPFLIINNPLDDLDI